MAVTFSDLLKDCESFEKKIDAIATTKLEHYEGRLFLVQMLRACYVGASDAVGDALNPHFYNIINSNTKYFADCPDTDYFTSKLAFGPAGKGMPDNRFNEYLVSIDINPLKTLYVGMVAYGKQGSISVAKPLFSKNSGCTQSNFNYLIVSKAAMMADNTNGTNEDKFKEAVLNRFKKTELGAEYRNDTGKHIEVIVSDNNVNNMVIRQYYENRDNEETLKCDIKLINGTNSDGRSGRSGRSDNKTGVNYVMAQQRYRNVINTTIFTRERSFGKYKANEIWSAAFDKGGKGKSMANRNFGTPNNVYQMARFELGDNSNYLQITIDNIPKCVYFGLCLYSIFLQSFDYSKGQKTCLNRSHLKENKNNGKYVIYVISNDRVKNELLKQLQVEDENSVNIMQTNGHINGSVVFRAVELKEKFPKIKIEQRSLPLAKL